MNDDLKAYIDGELPPDAAERIRVLLETDPALRKEELSIRHLGRALRALPEPEPVGQAATLAALSGRRSSTKFPLLRVWTPALAGCAALIFIASGLAHRHPEPRLIQIGENFTASATTEATLPAARRVGFIKFIHGLGGQVHKDGEGLRAFYPQAAHEEVKRHFLLPNDLAWPTDGLRIRLTP